MSPKWHITGTNLYSSGISIVRSSYNVGFAQPFIRYRSFVCSHQSFC